MITGSKNYIINILRIKFYFPKDNDGRFIFPKFWVKFLGKLGKFGLIFFTALNAFVECATMPP